MDRLRERHQVPEGCPRRLRAGTRGAVASLDPCQDVIRVRECGQHLRIP